MARWSCFTIKRQRPRVDINRDQILPTHLEPDQSDDSDPEHQENGVIASERSVRRFTWKDMEDTSRNFSTLIGQGGFSSVFHCKFSNSSRGALKVFKSSERLYRMFKEELNVLLHVRHHNIVKLLGYCDERDEGILVLEYINGGSLHQKLHGPASQLIPWTRRMTILYQLAQSLKYLHEECNPRVVHCDVTASNVLLDDGLNCKLCDFGSAKMGFSSSMLPSSKKTLIGSPGYIDPHYLRTGVVSDKTDVYSFGVLVLELVTGARAFGRSDPQLTRSMAFQLMGQTDRIFELVDPKLSGVFQIREAVAMVCLSAACLQTEPSHRPLMTEIVRNMEETISGLGLDDIPRVSVM